MNDAIFDELKTLLDTQGPNKAIDQLCQVLEKKGLLQSLLRPVNEKALRVGRVAHPDPPATGLPPDTTALRGSDPNAGQYVGQLCLRDGRIPDAWAFYRMLGEKEAAANAIENVQLLEGEDCQALINIAFHEGVHPRKGFDLLLDRYGLCSAITTVGGQEFRQDTDTRDYCLKRLVRALYTELIDRLQGEIERQEVRGRRAARCRS